MIAGLLPEIAADLDVGIAQAGLLITAFAIGMIVGSPLMAIATLHLSRRRTLVLALAVFALGHVIAALSPSFAITLAARALTALATGAFWSVAAVVASSAAGPAAGSRALGVVIGGLTMANVVGVPIGALAPVVTALAVRFAGRAPTLAAALSTSSFNFGIAVGSWVAGLALTSSLGEIGPALVGTVIAALTLVPLTMLAVTRRSGSYRSAAASLPRRLRASADFEPGSAV